VLLRAIVEAAISAGARLAEPGEFTLRAYLDGRVDLIQAEAVADLVNAVTPLQARAAFDQLEGTLTDTIRAIDAQLFDVSVRLEASLDFPDEGYHFADRDATARAFEAIIAALDALLADARRGRLIREGAQVVIVGTPNAGKSSLFNRLAGAGRAIVTPVPGTTRDLLTETIEIGGVPLTVVDTAGMRTAPGDAIEAEGVSRADAARRVADVVVVVLDSSRPLLDDDRAILEATARSRRVVVANKSDLLPGWDSAPDDAIGVSARTGEGMDLLASRIAEALAGEESLRDTPAITNVRHAELARRAREAVARAASAALRETPEEFVLSDLREARTLLEEITGARTPEDVLRSIFERFCIGK
jgi:tRNA modification GTPase